MKGEPMYYKMLTEFEGVPVQYVGVYVLRWQRDWGEPTVAFAEMEEDEESAELGATGYVLAHRGGVVKVYAEDHSTFYVLPSDCEVMAYSRRDWSGIAYHQRVLLARELVYAMLHNRRERRKQRRRREAVHP